MTSLPTGTITFLFTDIEGSTRRWEHHAAIMKAAVARHDAILRDAIESNGGRVFRTEGDAFRAAFQTAPQALQAAIDAQRALHSEPWAVEIAPILVRMALHTGAAEIRANDYVGPSLNRMARLLSAANGGQTLLSSPTEQLVRDSLPTGIQLINKGEHRLKDLINSEHIFQLLIRDLPKDTRPLHTLENRRNNLPVQVTPLIGREKQLADIEMLLTRDDVRLLTLTGLGGMGKTRLAMQAAANMLGDFMDGVWVVELPSVLSHELVIPTIAQVLRVKETAEQPLEESLKEYLNDKHILLVLDSFEHVMQAATAVGNLRTAPYLKILVTSREAMSLTGEHEFPVSHLTLPDQQHISDMQALSESEAVNLFIVRAQAIKPDFQMSSQNAETVGKICSKLEGIPLALELAAARIRELTLQSILANLNRRFELLTKGPTDVHPRHRTLRNTIDWSYDRLNNDEKRLFERMSVFRGGCTLETAQTVGALVPKRKTVGTRSKSRNLGTSNIGVLNLITSLVGKSLLRQQEGVGGEPRYFMLDTINEYALEKLEGRTEAKDIRRRYARCYLALAGQAYGKLVGPDQMEWLNRLEEEHDNLRAALHWVTEKAKGSIHHELNPIGDTEQDESIEISLMLAAALAPFWIARGYISEGREHLRNALSMIGIQNAASWQTLSAKKKAAYAGLLYGAGIFAMLQGDLQEAHFLEESSISIFDTAGSSVMEPALLNSIARLAVSEGNYAKARSVLEKSLALSKKLNRKDSIGASLNSSGLIAYLEGDYQQASILFRESLNIQDESGDVSGKAVTYFNLGVVALRQGKYEQGHSLLEKSLLLLKELRHKSNIPIALVGFAEWQLLVSTGGKTGLLRAEKSVRLLGASKALHESMNTVAEGMEPELYERTAANTRNILGNDEWEAAYQEGYNMSMDQAIEYALEDS